MKPITVFITVLALVISSVPLFAGHAAAAGASTLRMLTPSTTLLTGSTAAVDLILDTSNAGIAGVDVHITVPANLTYVSADSTNSVFPVEVTSPSLTGTDLYLSRALFTAGGYTGTNGLITRLTFTVTGVASTAQLQYNQATSKTDVYSDSSNNLTTTSGLLFTIKDKLVNIGMNFPYRSSQSQSGVTIQVLSAGTSTVVASLTNQTTSSTGSLSINDTTFISTLDDTITYDIKLSAPGYLRKKISSLTHILSQPYTFLSSQSMISGNYSGSNTIGFGDLITAIRGINGASDAGAVLATSTFGGSITVSNLVTLIRNYNSYPVGD